MVGAQGAMCYSHFGGIGMIKTRIPNRQKLILDDVSSLHTYKDQFSSIIAKDGFPSVITRLRAKTGD